VVVPVEVVDGCIVVDGVRRGNVVDPMVRT
jgi:hypothetical protein